MSTGSVITHTLNACLWLVTRCWDLLLRPRLCIFCRAPYGTALFDPLCRTCSDTITPVPATVCGSMRGEHNQVYAVGAYEHVLRALIHGKYVRDPSASVVLGSMVASLYQALDDPADWVVPIPLHWRREAQRGFNQATEMARVIEKKTGVRRVEPLRRIRATEAQAFLHKEARAGNIDEAFAWSCETMRRECRDKHILIIDDLFTTGATMREAVRVIGQARPRKITIIVAARAL